jgi:hypothetical protein
VLSPSAAEAASSSRRRPEAGANCTADNGAYRRWKAALPLFLNVAVSPIGGSGFDKSTTTTTNQAGEKPREKVSGKKTPQDEHECLALCRCKEFF